MNKEKVVKGTAIGLGVGLLGFGTYKAYKNWANIKNWVKTKFGMSDTDTDETADETADENGVEVPPAPPPAPPVDTDTKENKIRPLPSPPPGPKEQYTDATPPYYPDEIRDLRREREMD